MLVLKFFIVLICSLTFSCSRSHFDILEEGGEDAYGEAKIMLTKHRMFKIISRYPGHWRHANTCVPIGWALVSGRSRWGELRAERLSQEHGCWTNCRYCLWRTCGLLRGQLWDLPERRVEPPGGDQRDQERPQFCSQRQQTAPDWRISPYNFNKYRMDLVGRFSFPAGAFQHPTWTRSLHPPDIQRKNNHHWGKGHRVVCDRIPADRRRQRNSPHSNETKT